MGENDLIGLIKLFPFHIETKNSNYCR